MISFRRYSHDPDLLPSNIGKLENSALNSIQVVGAAQVSFVAEGSNGAVPLLELGQEGAESSTARVLVGDAARQQQVPLRLATAPSPLAFVLVGEC